MFHGNFINMYGSDFYKNESLELKINEGDRFHWIKNKNGNYQKKYKIYNICK
jgi:hypothetical protein